MIKPELRYWSTGGIDVLWWEIYALKINYWDHWIRPAGTTAARFAQAFGMRVLFFDPNLKGKSNL